MHKIGRRGRRGGRERCRGGGPRSSQRTSTLPWVPVDANNDTALPPLPFSADVGPNLSLPPDPKPIDFFRSLFCPTILQLIVDETNR